MSSIDRGNRGAHRGERGRQVGDAVPRAAEIEERAARSRRACERGARGRDETLGGGRGHRARGGRAARRGGPRGRASRAARAICARSSSRPNRERRRPLPSSTAPIAGSRPGSDAEIRIAISASRGRGAACSGVSHATIVRAPRGAAAIAAPVGSATETIFAARHRRELAGRRDVEAVEQLAPRARAPRDAGTTSPRTARGSRALRASATRRRSRRSVARSMRAQRSIAAATAARCVSLRAAVGRRTAFARAAAAAPVAGMSATGTALGGTRPTAPSRRARRRIVIVRRQRLEHGGVHRLVGAAAVFTRAHRVGRLLRARPAGEQHVQHRHREHRARSASRRATEAEPALDHEDAGDREVQQEHRVDVGEVLPRLLAARRVQPVRDADEEPALRASAPSRCRAIAVTFAPFAYSRRELVARAQRRRRLAEPGRRGDRARSLRRRASVVAGSRAIVTRALGRLVADVAPVLDVVLRDAADRVDDA